MVRVSAAADSRPVLSTPSPSRTMRIWRVTSVSGWGSPGAEAMSAISSLMEFVPQSIAATRLVTSPSWG